MAPDPNPARRRRAARRRMAGVFAAATREQIFGTARELAAGLPSSARLVAHSEDPMSDAVQRDVPAWWQRLHADGPVHWCPAWRAWLISGNEEVRRAARADAALSSAGGVMRLRGGLPIMLMTDRPDHERLRRLVAHDFTRSRMAATEPTVRAAAQPAIERIVAAGGGDAHTEISVPVPIEVIADLLGVPAGERSAFRGWSDGLVEASTVGVGPGSLRKSRRVFNAATAMLAYFSELVAERRVRPAEDLLSALAASHAEGALNDDELLWFSVLLIVAGNETTRSLISGLIVALAKDPAAYARLRSEPELIGSAVEEGLRWVSPVQGFFRTAMAPYGPVADQDVVINPGERVMLMWGAANRDPRVFDQPDEFRVGRTEAASGALAFGAGIHFCLGAHLARLEAAIVLEELLERVERIELLAEPVLAPDPTLRAIERVPVRFVPREPQSLWPSPGPSVCHAT